MRRIGSLFLFLGIILVALSIVLAELSEAQASRSPSRMLTYALFLGGLVFVLVSRLWGRRGRSLRSRSIDADRGGMKLRAEWLVALFLSFVIVMQLAIAFYLGELSAPFSLEVTPQHIDGGVAGQSYVFHVAVHEEGEGRHEGEAVKISVFAPDAKTSVDSESVAPGGIAEVTVTPAERSTGRNLSVVITGRRSKKHTITVTIMVNAPSRIAA